MARSKVRLRRWKMSEIGVTKIMYTSLIINNVSRIVNLNETEIKVFTSLLTSASFHKKELVLAAGSYCKHQTFVTKGCLKIFYVDPQGAEHVVKFAIENWWA